MSRSNSEEIICVLWLILSVMLFTQGLIFWSALAFVKAFLDFMFSLKYAYLESKEKNV